MSSRATPAAAAAPISSPLSDLTIDNGNHLLLSANQAALAFLRTIGSEEKLAGPARRICFRRSGVRRTLGAASERGPHSLVDLLQRTAACRAHGRLDYLSMMRLLRPGARREPGQDHRVRAACCTSGSVATALSCRAEHRAARGIGASRERDLARDLGARRPRLPPADRLGAASVPPSSTRRSLISSGNGAKLRFMHQLRAHLELAERRGQALDFGEDAVELSPRAMPSSSPCRPRWPAAPSGLSRAETFRAIVNAHFKVDASRRLPARPRHRQRDRGMAVRLSRSDLRHHQRRGPLDRDPARGC